MTALTFSKLTLDDLHRCVNLQSHGQHNHDWLRTEGIELSADELADIQRLQLKISRSQPHLLNEATVWAKLVFPLLALAEQGSIAAWSEVTLAAQYLTFRLEGIADGVLGQAPLGYLETPYLVVVEAKKGLGAETPQFQLYGQLLAAAHMNWQRNQRDPQEIFGCYTIATTWTFCRAIVQDLDSDRPTLILEISEELSEKFEADRILKILKKILSKNI
jgi:hypothetical protein